MVLFLRDYFKLDFISSPVSEWLGTSRAIMMRFRFRAILDVLYGGGLGFVKLLVLVGLLQNNRVSFYSERMGFILLYGVDLLVWENF